MANQVFANGREVSCKAADGRSTAAFPDVCLSPPAPPAGPLPIPYPNTAAASDTTEGSKTVKISHKEVMLKDKSFFKKSTGNEAATRSQGMAVVTHTIQGKVFFTSWSMDVKCEGENVVRHMDLTTHNHNPTPGNTPPWMHVDEMAVDAQAACVDEIGAAGKSCKGQQPGGCSDACKKAQKCLLVPKGNDKARCCKPSSTGHHMIEDHWVKGIAGFPAAQGSAGYKAAPTVCVEGGRYEKEHGSMHNVQGLIEESFMPGGSNAAKAWNYGEGKAAALIAHDVTFGDSSCSHECLTAQLDGFYGDDDERPLKAPETQNLAVNDPAGDGRWRRPDAETSMAPFLGGS
jgi:hypothetical protein